MTGPGRSGNWHPDRLALAVCAAGEPDERVSVHLDECAACAAEVAGLRAAMAALVGADAPAPDGPECLDDHAVARVAAGEAATEELDTLLGHVSACASCRARVAAVAAALSDDVVTRELRGLEQPRGRRWAVVAGTVAAVVAMLLLLPPDSLDDGTAVHRARSAAVAPAPELVGPVGAVADAHELRWRGVAGADVYRVTIYRADGSVLHEGEVADTVAAPSATVGLAPGTYYWTVAARAGRDRWTAAELASFTIAAREP